MHVSFQRYARPPDNVIGQAPSSLGALPVALCASGELALPVAPDEAFWIGCEMMQPGTHAQLAIRFESPTEGAVDALSGARWTERHARWIDVPAHSSVDGIALPTGGLRPFARTRVAHEDDSIALLALAARADAADSEWIRIILVDYGKYETMTGRARPAPLDRDAQYQGWLLP
jgi:hypothetical protein